MIFVQFFSLLVCYTIKRSESNIDFFFNRKEAVHISNYVKPTLLWTSLNQLLSNLAAATCLVIYADATAADYISMVAPASLSMAIY